ncbi:MAG: penicillin-binding protein activator LpoB [Nannocystaceae bacterium]|nr:penicillin-binding protein activator LpoB [Nannocystaceae bacterium]
MKRPTPSSRLAVVTLIAASLLAAPGCKPKAVRGGAGTDNPDLDEAAMGTGLDRKDIAYLADETVVKLQASPLWGRWSSSSERPIVAIWPIKNDTSEHLDDQMLTLLSDLETRLIDSGVVKVISRERQGEMIAEANLQQGVEFNAAEAATIGRQIGVDYYLTGKLQSTDERFDKERRVQYSLFMQVIEVETSAIEFQKSIERTKAIVR